MLKDEAGFDALGAEAMPGGLADIHRALQAVLESAQSDAKNLSKRKGLGRFFARRKKQQRPGA